MATLFEADSLTKTYEGRMVLNIPQLRLESGLSYALLGPNGSGKSTLLEILAGLVGPTSGTVQYRGRTLPPPPAAAGRLAGEVTLALQHPYLFRGSVRHNVEYGLRALGTERRELRERAERQMKALHLLELADRDARKLSGGERQRVSLARALALDTPVILLDEPLSHVDRTHRELVLAALRCLRARGRSVVIAAHAPDHVLSLTDCSITLEEGECRLIQNPRREDREICSAYDLAGTST